MKTKVSVSVKNPCSENFTKFKINEKGGFCMSCQKEVIDFRKLSDNQFNDHFQNLTKETCGIFTKSQLTPYENQNFTFMKTNPLGKGLGIMTFSLLALCTTQNTAAQAITSIEKSVQTEIPLERKSTTNNKKEQEIFTVRGSVQDENNEALPGVNIVLKGTAEGTQTDFDGKFEFPRKLKNNDVLIFSYLGYETKEVKIKSSESSTIELNVIFEDYDMILMGEVVVGGAYTTKRNIFQKFIGLFK